MQPCRDGPLNCSDSSVREVAMMEWVLLIAMPRTVMLARAIESACCAKLGYVGLSTPRHVSNKGGYRATSFAYRAHATRIRMVANAATAQPSQ